MIKRMFLAFALVVGLAGGTLALAGFSAQPAAACGDFTMKH